VYGNQNDSIGSDHLEADGRGHALLDGGPGVDLLRVLAHGLNQNPCPDRQTTLYGGADDDQLWGSCGAELMYGDTGNDTLSGCVSCAANADVRDELYGGPGDDYLDGGGDVDELVGDGGNDELSGGPGADHLHGDTGDDNLDGGAENDLLDGGAENDLLDGGPGDDELTGGDGDDKLSGGADND
jgi:Ca2+-binding RTX toxin-like protein